MMKRCRIPACAAAAAAGLFLMWGLAVFLGLSAVNAGMLENMMARWRLPQSDEKLPADLGIVSSDLIAGFYSGSFPRGVVDSPAFTEKELIHLTDCARLIRGLRLSGILAAAAGGVLVSAVFCFSRGSLWKGLFIAGLSILCFLCFLLIWGLISFDSLFLAFHRLSFSNQLWLLDPQKDLLIQLMPIAFFEDYALKLMVRILPVPCLSLIYCVFYRIFGRRKRGISG